MKRGIAAIQGHFRREAVASRLGVLAVTVPRPAGSTRVPNFEPLASTGAMSGLLEVLEEDQQAAFSQLCSVVGALLAGPVNEAAHTRAHEWLTHYRKKPEALPVCTALLWRALDADDKLTTEAAVLAAQTQGYSVSRLAALAHNSRVRLDLFVFVRLPPTTTTTHHTHLPLKDATRFSPLHESHPDTPASHDVPSPTSRLHGLSHD